MASEMCLRRLRKELKDLRKDPIKSPIIIAEPNEANILEWHYVIEGGKGTPYEGGYYHGKLVFPKEYPFKPPGVLMLTPSGRFQPNRRLCLSMSDFHPETWNPLWSVGTILTGLYSFMVETAPTFGSVETTLRDKRRFAYHSLEYNVRDKTFRKLFPQYVELQAQQAEERRKNRAQDEGHATTNAVSSQGALLRNQDNRNVQGLWTVGALVFAVVSIVFAFFRVL